MADLLTVDRKVVYRLIRSGKLPALRVGRLFRVDPADLQSLAFTEPPAPPARRAVPSWRPRPVRGGFGRLARQANLARDEAGGAA